MAIMAHGSGCCFCCTYRTGLTVIGVFSLIDSVFRVFLGGILLPLCDSFDNFHYCTTIGILFVFGGTVVNFAAILLLVGLYKNRNNHLIPYMLLMALDSVCSFTLSIFMTVNEISYYGFSALFVSCLDMYFVYCVHVYRKKIIAQNVLQEGLVMAPQTVGVNLGHTAGATTVYPATGNAGAGVQSGYPGAVIQSGYPGADVQSGYPGAGVQNGNPGAGNQFGYLETGIQTGYPGVGIGIGHPGIGVQTGYPRADVHSGYPGAGNQFGYPGAGIQSGHPGASIHSGYPVAGNQFGNPGYCIQSGYPSTGIQSGYPGSNVQTGSNQHVYSSYGYVGPNVQEGYGLPPKYSSNY